MATFPTTLPAPSHSFRFRPNFNTIRTEMESGYVRQRSRYSQDVLTANVKWRFSDHELWVFRGFVKHEINKGDSFFDISLPVGAEEGDALFVTLSVRIVNGEYDVSYVEGSHMYWDVSATLETYDDNGMTAAEAAALF